VMAFLLFALAKNIIRDSQTAKVRNLMTVFISAAHTFGVPWWWCSELYLKMGQILFRLGFKRQNHRILPTGPKSNRVASGLSMPCLKQQKKVVFIQSIPCHAQAKRKVAERI
jgi:hypothetical protein